MLFPEKVLSVGCTNELIRITRLPRRVRPEQERSALARQLTEAYRIPGGTMELRPVQAETLYEAGTCGGAFCPQACGAGKTASSFLVCVASAQRPLLVVPAKLVQKTERDKRTLAKHFTLPPFLRILTYEWLGRAQAADALEKYAPDLIIADECHFLRNPKAAVTRRFRRYMQAHPETQFVALSGTVTKRSLHDFSHLVHWALKEKSPLPRSYQDLELWADALDERKGQTRRADPGYLEMLCNEEEKKIWAYDRRTAARSAFRRRLVESEGIVATEESAVDASLVVQGVEPPVSKAIDDAFDLLREEAELPDGQPLWDGLEIFRHARELALGFYYKWVPPAPQDWRLARKAWGKFVREVLKHSRTLDSESQVRKANPDSEILAKWLAVKDSFMINTTPMWLDDSVLNFCADWAERERGIVWVEHVVFGERLEKDFGIPYYAKRGRDARGKFIDDHPVGEPMVASIQSNSEGRNLQGWSTNLVVSPPPNGKQWEQLLSRTHREGQQSDEVSVDVITVCAEHLGAVWQAISDCRYVESVTGSPQKLLVSSLNILTPDEVVFREGARWSK